MGLGGYLAARGEAEYYANEEKREWAEVRGERAAVCRGLDGRGVVPDDCGGGQ